MNQNKVYTIEYKGPNAFDGQSHFVIVVAASSMDVARAHVKEKIGIDVAPTWLMGAVYGTIWTSNGKQPEPIQAKILYNGNYHTK